MASLVKADKQKSPSIGSSAYATVCEPLRIPKTPLESRQGYHPKSVSPAPPTFLYAIQPHIIIIATHRKSNFDGADPQPGNSPGKRGYNTRVTYENGSMTITSEREIVSYFSMWFLC